MLCYKDKCFCIASRSVYMDELGLDACKNKKCDRHKCNVPFDKLPEWMPVEWSDFHERCGRYEK